MAREICCTHDCDCVPECDCACDGCECASEQ